MSNELCKCGKVGKISCPNDERCGSPTQLPAEVVDIITTQSETFANKYLNGKVNTHELGLLEEAWSAGATEYATKLHEAQKDNDELRRWKIEAAELLTKIHSYAHKHLEVKLGQCNIEFTIAQAKERDGLKARCDKMAEEHSDLNLALAAMLNGYQNLSMHQKELFTVPKDLIDAYTKMVLEYDKQEKEVENETP